MGKHKLARLTTFGFLALIITAPLAGIHQALAQVPGSTPVRTVDPVDPVQTFQLTPFANNAASTGNVLVITVPDKKRLVIEYVAVFATVPTGQDIVFAAVTTTVGGQNIDFDLTTSPRKVFDANTDITSFGRSPRLYADKNTDVTFRMRRNPATGASSLGTGVSISGYFVPQP
jgi:hypothetical protein